MQIGVMGAVGSFTEKAAQEYITEYKITDAEVMPLVHIDAVLEAVTSGAVDMGVFPIQNSVSGIVHSSVRGMSEHVFTIKDFFESEIDQNLLVVPGATSAVISTITSQKPAIDQCQSYLKRVWGDVEIETYVDTAQAAADLAAGKLAPTTAVIASRRCAEVYGLEILEESIQDLKHNFTTFLVVTKQQSA